MFQVLIDFCDHSSPNYVWEIHIHNIYPCLPAEVAANVESKLQELMELGSVWWSAKIGSPTKFLRGLHCDLWKLCKARFGEVLQKGKKDIF